MNGLRLAMPWLLALVPLVLALVWLVARRRARVTSRARLPRATTGIALGATPWVRLERLRPWLRGAALVLLVVGLARPQAGHALEDVSTLGVDIMIALDVSGSMRAEDFVPNNRLTVARRVVDGFVAGRPSDRIGLVTFGAIATTRCPLTLDHELLRGMLAEVDFAPPEQNRTAIGMGLAAAVNRLRRSDAKSRVAVLVTDGVNNGGQVPPQLAADAAAALGVRVYTVGVGRGGLVPMPFETPFGTQRQMVEIEFDEALLREIARATGGRYFGATDADTLAQVFTTIDALEKSEIASRVRVLYTERFAALVLPGLALVVLEGLLAITRLRTIP